MNIDFSLSELLVCILTILTSALSYIIKIQYDKIQTIKNQISDRKYNVYNEVFSMFFDIFKQNLNSPSDNNENFTDRAISIKKELLIYGTDMIIKQFTKCMDTSHRTNKVIVLKDYMELFILIRKDMGYNDTKIDRLNILELIMGNKEDAKKFEVDYFK